MQEHVPISIWLTTKTDRRYRSKVTHQFEESYSLITSNRRNYTLSIKSTLTENEKRKLQRTRASKTNHSVAFVTSFESTHRRNLATRSVSRGPDGAQQSRPRRGAARHPVVTSQSASGPAAGGGGRRVRRRRRARMAGGKKRGEDRLNVANVNYASGIPGVPGGAQVKKFSFESRQTPPHLDYGTARGTGRYRGHRDGERNATVLGPEEVPVD